MIRMKAKLLDEVTDKRGQKPPTGKNPRLSVTDRTDKRIYPRSSNERLVSEADPDAR